MHKNREIGYHKWARERAEQWANAKTKFCKGCEKDVDTDKFRKVKNVHGLLIPVARCRKCVNLDIRKGRAKSVAYETYRVKTFLKEIGIDDIEKVFTWLNTLQRECAICKQDEKDLPRKLVIDHCHKTKVIRGLLCDKCNRGIGQFQDDKNLLQEAIIYLDNRGRL